MKTARKPIPRRRPVKRAAPLSLTMRIERLEKEFLFKSPIAPKSTLPRFINLGADGKPTQGDHVAVYQTATDLIWTAAPLGTELTQPEALKAASGCRLLGAIDWRLPNQHELFSILDFELWNPCVDPKHFKGPYGFTWSATDHKGYAGYFRGVYLYDGDSYCYRQGGRPSRPGGPRRSAARSSDIGH